MVVYQFTIPMSVYQLSTKTSIFDDFFFPRIFGDFSFLELESADFMGLECRIVLYNSAEWFLLYKIQSSDAQNYTSFIFSGIETNIICTTASSEVVEKRSITSSASNEIANPPAEMPVTSSASGSPIYCLTCSI